MWNKRLLWALDVFIVMGTGEMSMGSLTLLSGGGHNFAVCHQGWRSGKSPDVKKDREASQTCKNQLEPMKTTWTCACPSPRRPGKPTEEAGPLLTELHLALAWSSEELGEP